MARRRILVVVEVVVPHKFFASLNVAQGEKPDPAFDLIHFAVGFARMIQIRAYAGTVDDGPAVFQSIEVSARHTVIAPVRLFGRDALAVIFDDASSFANGRRSVYADCVDGR